MWNLDFKMCQDCIYERQTSSLAKFSARYQQRNTRARTGKKYKYLGIEESEGIQNQKIKERLKRE